MPFPRTRPRVPRSVAHGRPGQSFSGTGAPSTGARMRSPDTGCDRPCRRSDRLDRFPGTRRRPGGTTFRGSARRQPLKRRRSPGSACGDDIHARVSLVEHRPATGEKSLVGGWCSARPVLVELRLPEGRAVGLVPDDYVSDRAEDPEQIADVAAIGGARRIVERGILGASVYREDDAHRSGRDDRVLEQASFGKSHLRLAGAPWHRQANGADTRRARDRDRRSSTPPLEQVVVHSDDEGPARSRADQATGR